MTGRGGRLFRPFRAPGLWGPSYPGFRTGSQRDLRCCTLGYRMASLEGSCEFRGILTPIATDQFPIPGSSRSGVEMVPGRCSSIPHLSFVEFHSVLFQQGAKLVLKAGLAMMFLLS